VNAAQAGSSVACAIIGTMLMALGIYFLANPWEPVIQLASQ
jgi:hypothetical protein